MHPLSKFVLTLTLLVASSVLRAESTPEMADTFRADGKIYVVVAIVLLVLVGFILYMISLDRKVTKLERLIGKNPKNKS